MSKASLSLELNVWENIQDRYGNPRLDVARNYFLPLTQDAIPLLCEAFKYWQQHDEYMILKGENLITGEMLYVARKCSKRGNDVYAARLRSRLGFIQSMDDVKFFDVKDFTTQKHVKTRLLWVTLTYDSNRCTLNQAWNNCMSEYNLWITNLRNKYGHIDVLGFRQPFPDKEGNAYGYPHFHLVLLFRDHELKVFPKMEQDSQGREQLVFRVSEKYDLEHQGKWHSFIDVKALSSARGVMNYCKAYAQNVCYGTSEKAILNSAVLWVYRKQTYSLSGGFRKAYHEFMLARHLSKGQMTLDGEEFHEWVWSFVGIRSAAVVDANGVWFKSLSKEEFIRVIGG